MDLQDFALQYNATRNANFIMWGVLLTKLAKERGEDGEAWLKELRQTSLSEMAAVEVTSGAGPSPQEVKSKDISRSVIEAAFDFSEHRLKSSD